MIEVSGKDIERNVAAAVRIACLEDQLREAQAQLDEIRGILGHPGKEKLPLDCSVVDLVRHAHHEWLRITHALDQRAIVAEARADDLDSKLREAQAESKRYTELLKGALEMIHWLAPVNLCFERRSECRPDECGSEACGLARLVRDVRQALHPEEDGE